MLVLSRKEDQKIVFPNLGVHVEVIRVKGKNVRLGIQAPKSIRVLRGELDDHESNQLHGSSLLKHLLGIGQQLDQKQRHRLRNLLNTANLSLAVGQRLAGHGMTTEADRHFDEAMQALSELDRMLLPTQEQQNTGNAPGPVPESGSNAVRLDPARHWSALVVEDNENERELLAGVLRMAGFEVTAVPDGRAAIDYLSSEDEPDVILMDINMPRLNGAQAISKIRNELEQDDLPIFAVSGLTQSEANVPMGDRGVTGWFEKPVNPDQLVRQLVQEIGSSNN